MAHIRLGDTLLEQKQFALALKEYEESFKIRQEQLRAEPENRWRRRALSIAHEKIANALSEIASNNDSPLDRKRALDHYQSAVQIASDLLKEPAPSEAWRVMPERLRKKIAELSAKMGTRSEAADAQKPKDKLGN
jgi:hypothetical protein